MAKTPEDPSYQIMEEIYTSVGRALSAWSWVEESLCTTYTRVIFEQTIPLPAEGYAQASFWAMESFRAKLNAVDSALRLRCRHLPETLKLWGVIYKRAREKNKKRNELAHGTVMNLGRPEETYFIPSMAKTMLADLAAAPSLPPDAFVAWLASQMYPNKLTATEINHRTQAFQMFNMRINKFNQHLHDQLPKITPSRAGWPLGSLE